VTPLGLSLPKAFAPGVIKVTQPGERLVLVLVLGFSGHFEDEDENEDELEHHAPHLITTQRVGRISKCCRL